MDKREALQNAIRHKREAEVIALLDEDPALFDDEIYDLILNCRCGRALRHANRQGLLSREMIDRRQAGIQNALLENCEKLQQAWSEIEQHIDLPEK